MEIFLREVLAHVLELHHDFSNKFLLMIIDFRKFTKLTETHFHLKSSLSIITHIPVCMITVLHAYHFVPSFFHST